LAAVGLLLACANRVYFDPAYFAAPPGGGADYKREPHLLWSFGLPAEPAGEISSFGGVLAVGTKNGSVWLVDKVKGKKLGVYDLSGVPAGVLFDGRESFIVAEQSGNGELFSYSLVDGAANWRFELNEAVEMPILKKGGGEPGGTLYAVNRAGKVFALRADDGKLLWGLPLAPVSCAPVWAEGALYLADFEGKLHAVKDGKIIQAIRLPRAALALEAGSGLVFAGIGDSTVAAISTADGGIVWRFSTGGKVRALGRSDSVLYYATTSGAVAACRVSDGQKFWERKLDVLFNAPLRVLPSIVLAGSAEGRLFALSARTGETLWERKLPGGLSARPIEESARLYLAAGKKILAFQF
jgi:outer membrane protein assembly factor BamB